MCGIVGATAKRPIAKLLLDGLKKLEYRGYDSAGAALLSTQGLKRLRVVGKVRELERVMTGESFPEQVGIAHTRWATHGAPSESNAHPLFSHDEFALVHNGIIENDAALRNQLKESGYNFSSETDTEVAVHLIHYFFSQSGDLLQAIRSAVEVMQGTFALGIVTIHAPGHLFAVRKGSPLIIGLGQGEHFIASDPLALLAVTQEFIYLEDHDIADLTTDQVEIRGVDGRAVQHPIHRFELQQAASERGEYRHYMKKEIMEQPDAIAACLQGRVVEGCLVGDMLGEGATSLLQQVEHVTLAACGTSYHAAMVARYWIESVARLPCTVEIASEFRYRDIAPPRNSLFVGLSQSGETADTLAALRFAKEKHDLTTIGIANVASSSLVREADFACLIHAGVEIGVAATKTFVTQLVTLLLLTLLLRRRHHAPHDALEHAVIQQLQHLPQLARDMLLQDEVIAKYAGGFAHKTHALFMGRGSLYPIALEGALKMKEISYIHAEGYPAGELKHGPLALVDHAMPVIALLPNDALFEKNISNIQEVRARGGKILALTDHAAHFNAHFLEIERVDVPVAHPLLAPILYTIPLQLLAYHVAVLKGTDVDQPRNLAKSVTVE
jgi:glucosamine--fructose-6-phosphate aminotransferase (isomerizing)